MPEPVRPIDIDAIEAELRVERPYPWGAIEEAQLIRKHLDAAFTEIRARRESDEIVLAFLCPICGHDGIDEDQCCSSCGADSYVVAKADAEDIGRRLKSLGHIEDLLAAWVAQKRSGNRYMSAAERAVYDEGVSVVEKRKEAGRG